MNSSNKEIKELELTFSEAKKALNDLLEEARAILKSQKKNHEE